MGLSSSSSLDHIFDLALTGKHTMLLLAMCDIYRNNFEWKKGDKTLELLEETRRLIYDQVCGQSEGGEKAVRELNVALLEMVDKPYPGTGRK